MVKPKRRRAILRKAAREAGGGLFVAQVGKAPAVLMNMGDAGEGYIDGPVLPGRQPPSGLRRGLGATLRKAQRDATASMESRATLHGFREKLGR